MPQKYVYYPQRFQSAAQYYSKGRPTYPPRLIQDIAREVNLFPSHRVLDLGTGPGFLAIDFAAYAGEVIGVDPALEMLEVARTNAETAGLKVTFLQGSSNELSPELGIFQVAVIGRAFHWMDREKTLDSLDALIRPGGAVVLFSESNPDLPANAWAPIFQKVLDTYAANDPARPQIRSGHRHEAVLLDSKFSHLKKIIVYERRATPLERFVDRALSYASVWAGTPDLNPQEVGERVISHLESFATNGVIHEVVAGEALIGRRT